MPTPPTALLRAEVSQGGPEPFPEERPSAWCIAERPPRDRSRAGPTLLARQIPQIAHEQEVRKLARQLGQRLELLQAGLAPLRIVRAQGRGHDLLEQARLALDGRAERLQVAGGDAVAGEPLADDHDLDVV